MGRKRIAAMSVAAAVALPSPGLGQAVPDATSAPEGFAGHWMGTLAVGGAQLRLRFEIVRGEDGLGATLYSIDQGNASIPVPSVVAEGETLTLSMPSISGSYRGSLATDGKRIEGTFTQMGSDLPLDLERISEAEAALRRPQNPEEPLPYRVESVRYPNPNGGHTLAGTLTRPQAGGPFPAVVLISGSGPQDRDESLMGHRPFLVLSDHLTRKGIAVLRFDDRGVGESTGDFASATSRDFATDALAGVRYLRTRDDVDAAAIGLAGHSEGGLVAPIAAVESDDVAYIVLMAGPGVRGEEILYAQARLILEATGAPDEMIARAEKTQRATFEALKSEADPERAGPIIAAIVRESLEEATEAERVQAGVTDEASWDVVVEARVREINTPWFRYLLEHDPATTLERVTVPVLAINGEKDLQVPHEANLRGIEAALARGGNDRYEIHALPDLNHLFQRARTGAPSEYAAIEETWSVDAMDLVADWILGVTGRTERQ